MHRYTWPHFVSYYLRIYHVIYASLVRVNASQTSPINAIEPSSPSSMAIGEQIKFIFIEIMD